MSRPTIAERGFLDAVLKDHLEPAIKYAKEALSDLEKLELCDAPGCGRLFDKTDPRSSKFTATSQYGSSTHFYCPACEMEARASTVSPSQSAPETVHRGSTKG